MATKIKSLYWYKYEVECYDKSGKILLYTGYTVGESYSDAIYHIEEYYYNIRQIKSIIKKPNSADHLCFDFTIMEDKENGRQIFL